MRNFILKNIKIATMQEDRTSYGLIENGAIALEDGKIRWCGNSSAIPGSYSHLPDRDLSGRLVTPALIDCHTHIVFGGNRAREFEMRLEGASYEEVARAGGGIVSTVMATREANEEDLLQDALTRVDAMINEGISTIEVKSGYGLDIETEIKMLRVAREIENHRDVKILTSFLGAHAVPKEYQDRPDDYIETICLPALDQAYKAGLVDAVDGFCEGIAFGPAQIERVFIRATELGLPVKLHAEQLSNLGGARLAARYNAISADHLEYIDEEGVIAMAKSGSVAVILPGAFYTLRETQAPPIDLFRKHKVAMAVATDCNPGSSPMSSLLLSMNMACTFFRMTPEEALSGVTRNAAMALGLKNTGTIEEGNSADLAIWNVDHPAELSYRIGFNSLHERISSRKLA